MGERTSAAAEHAGPGAGTGAGDGGRRPRSYIPGWRHWAAAAVMAALGVLRLRDDPHGDGLAVLLVVVVPVAASVLVVRRLVRRRVRALAALVATHRPGWTTTGVYIGGGDVARPVRPGARAVLACGPEGVDLVTGHRSPLVLTAPWSAVHDVEAAPVSLGQGHRHPGFRLVLADGRTVALVPMRERRGSLLTASAVDVQFLVDELHSRRAAAASPATVGVSAVDPAVDPAVRRTTLVTG